MAEYTSGLKQKLRGMAVTVRRSLESLRARLRSWRARARHGAPHEA